MQCFVQGEIERNLLCWSKTGNIITHDCPLLPLVSPPASCIRPYSSHTVPYGQVSKPRSSLPSPRRNFYFECEVLPTKCGTTLKGRYMLTHGLWRLLQAKIQIIKTFNGTVDRSIQPKAQLKQTFSWTSSLYATKSPHGRTTEFKEILKAYENKAIKR